MSFIRPRRALSTVRARLAALVSPLSLALLVALFVAGPARGAHAQTTDDVPRAALTVTEGYRVSEATFAQSVVFERYAEDGSLTAAYAVGHRPITDVGLSVHVWRRVGASVSGSYLHDPGSAEIRADIPSPFAFNQPRTLTGATAAAHTEIGLHLQAIYWLQPHGRLHMALSGGPTLFRVDQELVTDVTYSQEPPYDTVTYEGATIERRRQTVVGGTIAGSAAWPLSPQLDLVAEVRYSRASASFPDTSAGRVTVGGLNTSAGLRLRF